MLRVGRMLVQLVQTPHIAGYVLLMLRIHGVYLAFGRRLRKKRR